MIDISDGKSIVLKGQPNHTFIVEIPEGIKELKISFEEGLDGDKFYSMYVHEFSKEEIRQGGRIFHINGMSTSYVRQRTVSQKGKGGVIVKYEPYR